MGAELKHDFSGYATKAGLKCSDGRTIMPDAFKHQDKTKVPLVWQHGHTDVENVIGHALLENRPDGVYAYGFFNNSKKGIHTREIVQHRDINMMSIWANQLIQRAGNVIHGAIREVSLVLSGANPGALIENVTIHHSDGDDTMLEDEVIIYTGLELEHDDQEMDVQEKDEPVTVTDNKVEKTDDSVQSIYDSMNDKQKSVLVHMLGQALDTKNATDEDDNDDLEHADDETVQDIYDSMNKKQKDVLHYMIGEALAAAGGEAKQDNLDENDENLEHADAEGETVQDVYDSMSQKQKDVLHYMIGEALAAAGDSAQQDNMNDETNTEGNAMRHNVFEKGEEKTASSVLSHSDITGIVADATKNGSLKDAVENYALAHGITDIDVMFPDARVIADMPEVQKRRTEWVQKLLAGTRKSPFSRIKTLFVDLTLDDARAKGYVKGALKKEEFFAVAKRVTTPATVYKKQKLDRDDVVDITDFDVVVWLKAEMRLMLDEEVARAILIGDGREVNDEDKISETNIRPIASDHELYVTTVNVNIGDANSSGTEIVDAIIVNRKNYRGTGLPNLYTSETYISMLLMIKDTTGRRIYKTLADLSTELRVSEIIAVEVMEDTPEIVAILVNPIDYVIGADKGGNVAMFDDFDIDYNQYKYLIETRLCGALVKLKSAIVVRKVAGSAVLAAPPAPDFDLEEGEFTITNTTGVVYKNAAGTVLNAAGSPYSVTPGTAYVVNATPAAGYYFASSDDDSWSFYKPV